MVELALIDLTFSDYETFRIICLEEEVTVLYNKKLLGIAISVSHVFDNHVCITSKARTKLLENVETPLIDTELRLTYNNQTRLTTIRDLILKYAKI